MTTAVVAQRAEASARAAVIAVETCVALLDRPSDIDLAVAWTLCAWTSGTDVTPDGIVTADTDRLDAAAQRALDLIRVDRLADLVGVCFGCCHWHGRHEPCSDCDCGCRPPASLALPEAVVR